MKFSQYGGYDPPSPEIINDISILDRILLDYYWEFYLWEDLLDAWLQGYFLFTVSCPDENRIIGFSLFSYVEIDDLAHLLKIALVEEFRGRGIGEWMLQSAIGRLVRMGAEKFYLEVDSSNLKACKLYRKVGFSQIHFRKNYYDQGRDALIMAI